MNCTRLAQSLHTIIIARITQLPKYVRRIIVYLPYLKRRFAKNQRRAITIFFTKWRQLHYRLNGIFLKWTGGLATFDDSSLGVTAYSKANYLLLCNLTERVWTLLSHLQIILHYSLTHFNTDDGLCSQTVKRTKVVSHKNGPVELNHTHSASDRNGRQAGDD